MSISKVQQRDPRKSESWNLQKESEVLIAITNTKPELTARPPNDSPREKQNSVCGAGSVYGNGVEWGICRGKPRDCGKE